MQVLLTIILAGIILTAIIFIALRAKSNKDKKIKVSAQSFGLGTLLQITSYGKNSDEALNQAIARIGDIDDEMSFFKDESDICRINKNSGENFTTVSYDTYYVIKRAAEYSSLSDGAIDLTVRPLVSLWGFGREKFRAPEPEEVKRQINLVDYNNILFDETQKSIKLKNHNMSMDVNCIAKGYAADEVRKVLIKHKIKNAIINLGGNVYAHGSNINGLPWNVGIQHPFKSRGNYIGYINVIDKSVVTSGDYEKFIVYNNEKYHHIINPKTGYPVKNKIVSTTVISDYSIDGDAVTTCLFVLGVEEGLKFAKKLKNVEAIIITEDKLIYATEKTRNSFVICDDEFSWG